jgi:peptide/nickel transport system permease protein
MAQQIQSFPQQNQPEGGSLDPLDQYLEGTQTSSVEPLSFGRIALRRLFRDRLTLFAMGIILLMVIVSLLADVISQQILGVDPNSTDLQVTFQAPSREHLLGTDQIGRDQLARLLVGGRTSLAIGFAGAFIAMTVGVAVGLSAGFFGGRIDDVVMWIINTLQSIPQIFLLLIVFALFSPTPTSLVLILGFLSWVGTSRLVRGEVFSVRERDYVTASRALGASQATLMTRHILPNIIPIVIIVTAIDIGTLILIESALSFIGLGVQPPTATWGNMLAKAQQYFHLGPHLIIFPGLLITITVLCLFLIGDGLRDALDPRLK